MKLEGWFSRRHRTNEAHLNAQRRQRQHDRDKLSRAADQADDTAARKAAGKSLDEWQGKDTLTRRLLKTLGIELSRDLRGFVPIGQGVRSLGLLPNRSDRDTSDCSQGYPGCPKPENSSERV